MDEDRVHRVGVLRRSAQPGTDHRAYDQGDLRLAAEHVTHLGSLIGDLVEANPHETDEHQLDNRAQAGSGTPDAGTYERRLGNGRVANTLAPEVVDEAFGNTQRAAPAVEMLRVIAVRRSRDVFTHQNHGRVAPHFLAQRLIQCFPVTQ